MTARMVLARVSGVRCETPTKGFLICLPEGHKGVQVAGSNRWGRAPPPSVSRYCRLRGEPTRPRRSRQATRAQAGCERQHSRDYRSSASFPCQCVTGRFRAASHAGPDHSRSNPTAGSGRFLGGKNLQSSPTPSTELSGRTSRSGRRLDTACRAARDRSDTNTGADSWTLAMAGHRA